MRKLQTASSSRRVASKPSVQATAPYNGESLASGQRTSNQVHVETQKALPESVASDSNVLRWQELADSRCGCPLPSLHFWSPLSRSQLTPPGLRSSRIYTLALAACFLAVRPPAAAEPARCRSPGRFTDFVRAAGHDCHECDPPPVCCGFLGEDARTLGVSAALA